MIAKPKPRTRRITSKHQKQFLAMLRVIAAMAQTAFRDADPENREEAEAEVIAHAFVMFAGLVRSGREALAYAVPLAMFGIKRVRIGRQAATALNCNDVSSTYGQLKKRMSVQRLDRYDKESGGWLEALVEDKHVGPDQVAASRIDVADWLARLPHRNRRIAEMLALGCGTEEMAKRFRLSAGRISRLRGDLRRDWEAFQHEEPARHAGDVEA
jgi:hypothetical protein